MSDMGYFDVTSECPVEGCAGSDVVRFFGSHGNEYYRTVKCSTCGDTYSIRVQAQISGTIVEYGTFWSSNHLSISNSDSIAAVESKTVSRV